MSFLKNFENVLVDAKNSNIIDETTQHKLLEFAQNKNKNSSYISFVNILGFLGGFTILLGLSLIIALNWKDISNITKITTYIATLAGFHIAGLKLQNSHKKISQILHFIGAGYVLLGIGLMAQMFNLTSNSGTAYLSWFIMIFPLAIILQDRWIGLMAAIGFYSWLTINSSNHGQLANYSASITYFCAMSISLILLPKIIERANSCLSNLRFAGAIILMSQIFAMGFYHKAPAYVVNKSSLIGTNSIILIIVDIIFLGYFLNKKINDPNEEKYEKYLNLLLLFALLLPLAIDKIAPILLSIIYCILWFAFCFIMVYNGAIKNSRTAINLGSWCAIIGILARFFDLIGTMLFSGSLFIIFGILLIVIAYFGDKIRKYLLNKYFNSYAK